MGYSKRELANHFQVAETTIWYNIYGRKRRTRRVYLYKRQQKNFDFTDIKSFVDIVENMRKEGLSSGEVAHVFEVPLKQINLIWCKSL